jgi:DNA gyrase/topoisomerase IV subunit A
MLISSEGRGIQIKSPLIPEMSTRSASGVQIIQLKRGAKLTHVEAISPDKYPARLELAKNYRKLKIPAAPAEVSQKELLDDPPVV